MCWHDKLNFISSDHDDLKVTSDIIYQTEFYHGMMFQGHTGATTLIFFLISVSL